jgi:iduronate 2-sulfatase
MTTRNHCFQKQRLGRAIRTETHRLVVWQSPDEPDSAAAIELYEYADGPVEKKNIAAENPEIVRQLRAILDRHPAPETGTPRRQRNRAN